MKEKTKTVKVVEIYGEKRLRVTLPADARLTFGPWSPPSAKQDFGDRQAKLAGTLRAYRGAGTTNILAVFTNVVWFHVADVSVEDLSLPALPKSIGTSITKGRRRRPLGDPAAVAQAIRNSKMNLAEVARESANEMVTEVPLRIVAETLKEEETVRRRRDNGS